MSASDKAVEFANDDSATGFPGVSSWRSIYLIVISIFAIYVAALTALSRAFQ